MIGLDQRIGEFGGTEADLGQIAADALDDEVLADTARHPTGDDIRAILMACAG